MCFQLVFSMSVLFWRISGQASSSPSRWHYWSWWWLQGSLFMTIVTSCWFLSSITWTIWFRIIHPSTPLSLHTTLGCWPPSTCWPFPSCRPTSACTFVVSFLGRLAFFWSSPTCRPSPIAPIVRTFIVSIVDRLTLFWSTPSYGSAPWFVSMVNLTSSRTCRFWTILMNSARWPVRETRPWSNFWFSSWICKWPRSGTLRLRISTLRQK